MITRRLFVKALGALTFTSFKFSKKPKLWVDRHEAARYLTSASITELLACHCEIHTRNGFELQSPSCSCVKCNNEIQWTIEPINILHDCTILGIAIIRSDGLNITESIRKERYSPFRNPSFIQISDILNLTYTISILE